MAKISKLLDAVKELEIVVPEFQREYVWSLEQAKELMVSLFQEYPMGSILVWETNSPPEIKNNAVSDAGEILGIEKDCATLKNKNKDGFLLQLTQVINQYIGKEFNQDTSIKIIKIGGKDVCVVDVINSAMPVFLKNADKEEFYIRASASSQPMSIREANEYIRTHWD